MSKSAKDRRLTVPLFYRGGLAPVFRVTAVENRVAQRRGGVAYMGGVGFGQQGFESFLSFFAQTRRKPCFTACKRVRGIRSM